MTDLFMTTENTNFHVDMGGIRTEMNNINMKIDKMAEANAALQRKNDILANENKTLLEEIKQSKHLMNKMMNENRKVLEQFEIIKSERDQMSKDYKNLEKKYDVIAEDHENITNEYEALAEQYQCTMEICFQTKSKHLLIYSIGAFTIGAVTWLSRFIRAKQL